MNEKEAEHIIANLKRKATHVEWYNAERKEHYGVIAKTIEGKEKLRKKGYILFDFKDFEGKNSSRQCAALKLPDDLCQSDIKDARNSGCCRSLKEVIERR